MARDVDEYGVPIKKQASQQLDEYGVPVKKSEDMPGQINIPLIGQAESDNINSKEPIETLKGSPEVPGTNKPKTGKDYEWSDGEEGKTKLSTDEKGQVASTVNLHPSKTQQYKDISKSLKEKHEAYINADVAKMDYGSLAANPKIKAAVELGKQLQLLDEDPKNNPQRKELQGKLRELLNQQAEEPAGPDDWEGSVNGKVYPSITKGKTVSEAIDLLNQKAKDFNENSKKQSDAVKSIDQNVSDLRAGDNFQLTPGKNFKELGAVDNFFHSAYSTFESMIQKVEWATNDDEGKKAMAERNNLEKNLVFPMQETDNLPTHAAGMVGGVVPYLIGGSLGAAAKGTVGALIATGAMMGASEGGSNAMQVYQEAISQGMTEDDALKVAKTMSNVNTGLGIVLGVGTGLIGGEIKSTGLLDYVQQSILKNIPITAAFVGMQALNNKIAQSQGLDRRITQGLVDNGESGMALGLMMDLLHVTPKLFSPEMKTKAEIMFGKYGGPKLETVMDDAVKKGLIDFATADNLMNGIKEKAKVLSGTPNNLKPEDYVTMYPMLEQIHSLEQSKDGLLPPFKADIDRQIQDQYDKIAEKLGTPLSDKEKAEMADLKKKEKENGGKLNRLQRDTLNHFEKRLDAIDATKKAREPVVEKKEESPPVEEPKVEEAPIEPVVEKEQKSVLPKPEEVAQHIEDNHAVAKADIYQKLKDKTITRDEARKQVADLQKKATKELVAKRSAESKNNKEQLKPVTDKFDEYDAIKKKKGISRSNAVADFIETHGEEGIAIKAISDNWQALKKELEDAKLLNVDCG